MRALKFKFWNKLARRFQAPNKYAIQGDGLYVSYDYDMMAWDDPSSFDDIILVPCQYTGLKDKNGKEIYEGDIMKVHGFLYDCDSREEKPIPNFTVTYYSNNKSISEFYTYWMADYPCEVIGNIFENSDLLTK